MKRIEVMLLSELAIFFIMAIAGGLIAAELYPWMAQTLAPGDGGRAHMLDFLAIGPVFLGCAAISLIGIWGCIHNWRQLNKHGTEEKQGTTLDAQGNRSAQS